MPNSITLKFYNPHSVQCHTDPQLFFQDNFISPVECRHIIGLAREKLQRARVSMDEESQVIDGRSGSNCWIRYDSDSTVRSIGMRIAALVGLPLENAESLQVVYYDKAQEYRPHFDAYDLSTARGKRCCKRGGQRLVTALVYLNEVSAGGETGFPKLAVDVKPSPGRMVVFCNTGLDSNKPHPLSLHAGRPVLEGEKWAFNMWFHAEPMQKTIDFERYTSPQVLFDQTPANAAAKQETNRGFSVKTNRAQNIFAAAVQKLDAGDAPEYRNTCFTYWNTYGGNYLDLSDIAPGARIISLISKNITNVYADKKRLPELFKEHGLGRLMPATFADPAAAYRQSPDDRAVWFVKHAYGTAGKGMYCVTGSELKTLVLEKNCIVQKGVTGLALIDGRKFAARIYVFIWNQDLYLYREGFLMIHGPQYDPGSTDYKVQIDHGGYTNDASPVSMALFSKLDKYQDYFEKCKVLATTLKQPLSAALTASSRDNYSVLGIDLMLLANGEVKLIDINSMPNFIHTDDVNNNLNIPFFADVIATMLGTASSNLLRC